MTRVATLDEWAAARMGLAAPLSRQAVEAWQCARIAETITYARAASPFYRSRLDWPQGEVSNLADFARLPFTGAADLARNDPTLVAVSQCDIARVVTLPSSGTSGLSKRLFFTADELEDTIDFFHHGMALFTRPSDRVAILFSGDRPGSVGDGLAKALGRLGATAIFPPAAGSAAELAALLRREKVDVIAGPPVRMLAAARASACDGSSPLSIRAVLSSTEPLARSVAKVLTAIWGCEVYDHWGMTETGLGGGVECFMHTGCHLRETDLFVEVVDPTTGAPLPAGRLGEVVITTLRRRGLPLVRYRTGDLARLIDAPCDCGSILRRLADFSGRVDAAVPLPDGAHLTLQALDEALFAIDGVSDFSAHVDIADIVDLHLTVATPQPQDGRTTRDVVFAALAADPAMGPALAAGRLRVTIELAAADLCKHDGKRRLNGSTAWRG